MSYALPRHPWLAIWVSPRETIRQIVETDPKQQVILLAILAGIGQSLDKASSNSVGDRWSFSAILVLALIVGPLRGLVSLYLGGAIVRWVGVLLGGQASAEDARAAIAWSQVPLILVSVLWLPKLLLFGQEMFTTATPGIDSNPLLLFSILGFSLVEISIAVWAFVLLLKCIGEVHRFSAWKALAVVLLPMAAIFVIVSIVVGASIFLL